MNRRNLFKSFAALAAAWAWPWKRKDVALHSGELAPATDLQIANGANRAVVDGELVWYRGKDVAMDAETVERILGHFPRCPYGGDRIL